MSATCSLKLSLLLLVVSTGSVSGEDSPNFNGNFFMGSQAIYGPQWDSYRITPFAGHEYHHAGFDMLAEMRETAASSAMNQFKFKLSDSTCESYKLRCANQDDDFTLRDLATEPEVANTLSDFRFKWYHIWTYSFNLPKPFKEDNSPEVILAEYQETYDLAVHLLETYAGTGKTFFLGNWEGDWELMWASKCKTSGGFDMTCKPTDEVVDRYIKWAQIRQAAIDDARAVVGAENVQVFYYIEFNLAQENFEGDYTRPTILNSVVPSVNPDYLSYSSYKSTNRYINHGGRWFNQGNVDALFHEVLDYAQSKLTPTETNFSAMGDNSKRVFIGEYGPGKDIDPWLARTMTAAVIRASLEWGVPFVLQWAMYDNHTTEPLLRREAESMYSDLAPIRQLYVDWRMAATQFVADFNPTSEELRLFAVEWFSLIQQG